MLNILFSAIVILMLAATQSWGDVMLKNGNYFVTYNDVDFSGGLEPKIERTYSSKSSFKGIFGWGWGCKFEVHLKVAADGSVIVHEYGGGSERHYFPPEPDREKMLGNVNRLVQLKFPNPSPESEAYRTRLMTDAVFRGEEWNEAANKNLVGRFKLGVGTILTNTRYGHAYIVRTRTGYIRYKEGGLKEEFDDRGQQVKVVDTNDNFISYSYDDKGRMVKQADNYGRWIALTYNGQGQVSSLVDSMGRKAEYRYNQSADLIYSRDASDNVFEFDYDNRHNLIAIRYSDGSIREISYYSKAHNDSVRKVKDRDGSVTSYTFDFSDRFHYKVGYQVEDSGNRILSKEYLEYFIVLLDNGMEYTRRMIKDLDGEVTDTEYNENNLPLKITRNGEEVRFAYDRWGHMTLKEAPLVRTELEYQPVVNKISRVRVLDKTTGSEEESEFSYDSKGNLISARNKDKGRITLTYDPQGRIASVLTKDEELSFTYNENSKPLKIAMKGTGEITVTYAADGEIEKVESPSGRKIALEVTAAFQRLLEIIKPAGVSLSF